MDGLLVVGLQHGAGEGSVAAALNAVLRREAAGSSLVRVLVLGDDEADALHAFGTLASPAVAAAEAGVELDPTALAAAVRERAGADGRVVAAVPGGLLAPLSTRHTVRDLAAELGLPVVLALPVTADAGTVARLSLAAARAARLAVVALVLTGWPEAPDRVQLDEQRLLGAAGGVGVLTLPASPGARADEVRSWPVLEWVRRAPEPEGPLPPPLPARGPTATRPATVHVELDPYDAWEPEPVGDPRTTPRPRLMAALEAIVAVEGPVLAARAYALYNRAAGGRKLTTAARAPLSSAAHWLAQERRIVSDEDVLRLPDQPPVRVRALGPRTLEEVPLTEIAELIRRLDAARGSGPLGAGGDSAPGKRAVLDAYGLTRLTQRADEYLTLAGERL